MANAAHSTTLSKNSIATIVQMNNDLTLLETIQRFRLELNTYNEFDDETLENMADAISATYGRFMDMLENWTNPATSHEEALAALRLAYDESYAFAGSLIVEPLLKAALGYFDKKH